MRRLCVANEKGGTGKTTTAVALAGIAAESGRKTLLVDLDPQASVSSWFHVTSPAGRSVAEVLAGRVEPVDVIVAVEGVPNLHLLPASKDLAGAEAARLERITPRWQLLLRDILDRVEHLYDLVIVDCPPGFGALLTMGLAACDEVIIPVVPAYLDYRGIQRIEQTIEALRQEVNPRLRTVAVLPTRMENTVTHKNVRALLEERYGNAVIGPIRKAVAAADAPLAGMPLHTYRPKAEVTTAYREVARRLGLTGGAAT